MIYFRITQNICWFHAKRITILILLILFNSLMFSLLSESSIPAQSVNTKQRTMSNDTFNRPMIFIGGFYRSGTTLMRAILDVHDLINCGPETKVLPAFLKFIQPFRVFFEGPTKSRRDTKSLDLASAKFIYQVVNDQLADTHIGCVKDPEILVDVEYLNKLFPKAKFIYMVRDGRSAAYSLMTHQGRPKTISEFMTYLRSWNIINERITIYSKLINVNQFKTVKYEDLVLRTKETVQSIVQFLNVSWTDEFLHHEKHIGTKIEVAEREWSTSQIKKSVYKSSLSPWMTAFNLSNYTNQLQTFNMLSRYGYI